MPKARGAESWWSCSDSDSSSDSGSNTKYNRITLKVNQISAVQARKRYVTFPIEYGFHSFGRKTFNLGHVIIYQLFNESSSSRILVLLDINNKCQKINIFKCLHNYIMGCIIWEIKMSKCVNHSKCDLTRC